MKNKLLLCLAQFLFATVCFAQINNTRLNPISLTEHNYVDTPITINFTISNNLGDTIRSLSISYTINGGAPVRATIQTFLSGVIGGTVVVLPHPVPLLIHTPGNYTIHAAIDSVDGVASATPYSDSVTVYARFYQASPLLHKKVMLEEFTGAWCGHCSGGAYNFESILETDTDFIGVACHIATGSNPLNDSMNSSDGVAIHDTYTGYPTVMMDRCVFGANGRNYGLTSFPAVATTEGLTALRKTMASPANVSLTSLVYDSTTGTLSVDVNAEFLDSLYGGDYRVNLSLIEDSIFNPNILPTAYSWNQNNYNYSHLSPSVDDTIPALFPLSQSLLDNGQAGGWAHNHVLRKMLGGPWGDTAVIPSSPAAGSTYTRHYSYTLPADWDPNRISLIGIVQEYHTINGNHQPANWSAPDLILNAVKSPLIPVPQQATSGIVSVNSDPAVRVYPNPSNGSFQIWLGQTPDNAGMILYDMTGKNIVQKPLTQGINHIDTELPDGIYQLKISIDGHERNEKIVILK